MSFSDYYAATDEKPLHPIFEELAKHLPAGGVALDLGCGVGHGLKFLAENGFEVFAIDSEQEALDYAQKRVPEDATVHLICSRLEDVPLPQCELAVAQFSLFFLDPHAFREFWARLQASLLPGALFAGQFLGMNDDWSDRGYSIQTPEEVAELLADFDMLYYEEAERDGETAVGTPKHWHVFHVIARKRR